jgi:hypothetical protein
MREDTENRRLIRVPSFEPAFAFGWRSLWRSMSEWWGAYIAIALIGAALTGWGASAQGFRTASVEWIAMFFGLATATRFARPSFAMTFTRACAVLSICLLTILVPLLIYIGCFFFAVSLATATKAAWPVVVLSILFFILTWIVPKFSLAPAFYTLDGAPGFAIAAPIRRSWVSVSGATWWRVLGISFCVGLICCFVLGWVAIGAFFALRANPAIAAFVAALIFYAGSIPASIWTVGSFVALASSLREHPDPFIG